MTAVTATTPDAFRPAMHYAARSTWLNDPNGLIFHEGIYHLYYQNNPEGNVWGNMSWGHATSTDLVTWVEQPVAIAYDELEDIYSGSIVFDRYNTSGFGTEARPPLVAVYTSAFKPASELSGVQAQSLAYSLDGGYTWTKYAGNPVLNRGSSEFRDPKVFRFESDAESYWIMVAVEALDFKVVFYSSLDLKKWELLSSFGPANATGGVWECPDLFPLPVDGDPENLKWVLTINLNPGGPNSGSAGQYFVGDFDGVTFTSSSTVTEGLQAPDRLGDYQWLDWGRDYYAAVSFSDVPDGRRLMIAWMNNWQYANEIPTSPWRSPMSLIREVSLQSVDGTPRLVQHVARELASLPSVHPPFTADDTEIAEGKHLLDSAAGSVQRIEASLSTGTAEEFGVIVRGEGTRGTRIGIRPAEGRIVVDRRESGQTGFHESFASTDAAPIQPTGNSYEVTIYVDHCSVEVFAQGGQITLSELIFPASTSTDVSVYACGGTATINSLKVTQLA
ncbi:glycoside hydrolase family 32 protein [Arthrobacter sp. FW306-2-2C-D06B]|uniref:glycoside hydrolase family 32 protein n=1 Tax=Arthrobacter sp. FW306-2-2C-D06B TaxID=2879618 RepID=UPI001F4401E9|nr:glycoside hydrolase family 32 protein [Arthrobacter sp. FW306-2-2C-D06B]UKA60618.1 glycoside hydrolase family 32 protein [Arthrobacter sp. FW306-2-2C-D06B]